MRSKTSEDLLFWRLCCASQNLLFSIAFLHKCKCVYANELHVCVAEVKPATSYQPLEPVTHTNCTEASSCVGSTSMMLQVAIHHIKQLIDERSWNASPLHILCIGQVPNNRHLLASCSASKIDKHSPFSFNIYVFYQQ